MNNVFKKIKFEKSGLPIIPVCFYFIILISVFMIINIIKTSSFHFNVKGFNYPLENINITFEADDRLDETAYLVCFEDYCKSANTNEFRSYYNAGLTSDEREFYEKKVNKILFAGDTQIGYFPNNIKNIDINIGNKNIYLNKEDISKLEKKEISINLKSEDGKKEVKKYNALILPEISNYKGFLSHITNIFLSLFYNWKIFIFPYSWLILAFLIFVFNRDEFKFNLNLNKKSFCTVFGMIFFAGVVLRLADISYYPLWIDEVYTKQIAINDFLSCFKDAGNPPLFFILEYLFTKIFSTSLFSLRFLPFVFGMLFILYTYKIFEETDKKEDKLPIFALFCAFLASINTVNIYHSQEARGYSLCMFLIIASIYYLFRYLKNPNKKDLIITGVLNILLVNCNYYLILFTFSNFIWGIVDLFQNKTVENKLKETLKFVSTFIVAGLTFIPYLIISSKTALSDSFNGWIPVLSKDTFLYTINEYFINKYVFIALCFVLLINLIISFIPKNILEKINIKINGKRENLFLYLIYTITLIIILACLISVFIKPIFHKRVLLSIYSLLFLIETVTIGGFIEFIKENKFLKGLKSIVFIILLFAYFSITSPMPTREYHNLDKFMKFVENDIKQFNDSYEIHLINAHTKDYLKEYPEILNNKRIKLHFFNSNQGVIVKTIKKSDDKIVLEYAANIKDINNKNAAREEFDKDKNKKAVVYFNTVGVDMENIASFNPAIRVYPNNSASTGKLIFGN